MAQIDNSGAEAFWSCPRKYYESYVRKIEPLGNRDALDFGTRVHQLLAEWFGATVEHKPLAEPLESEAQEMLAAYRQVWPRELDDFEVLAVERRFEVPLGKHVFVGRFDGVIRNADGRLSVLEHKTERRNGRRNLPRAWAMRPQVGLYTYAASQVFGEPCTDILLDILTRRSPKGMEGPAFRRDRPNRLPDQQQEALDNLAYIADQIDRCVETGVWPANRGNCTMNDWPCDFYDLHLYGADEASTLRLYQPKAEYLEGV